MTGAGRKVVPPSVFPKLVDGAGIKEGLIRATGYSKSPSGQEALIGINTHMGGGYELEMQPRLIASD